MSLDHLTADGVYELVADQEQDIAAQEVNLMQGEDLNQSSEEPKATIAPEGKHRSMTH